MKPQVMVEVVAGASDVREIRSKETQQVRAIKQTVYLHLGGPFPEKAQITVERPLQPGKYMAALPIRIGRYDSPEIAAFDAWELSPAKPEEIKKAV